MSFNTFSSIKEYKQYLSQNKCMVVPYSLINEHKQEVELSDVVEEDLEDILKLSRFHVNFHAVVSDNSYFHEL